MGHILGRYWDKGKQHGNYYLGFRGQGYIWLIYRVCCYVDVSGCPTMASPSIDNQTPCSLLEDIA